MIKGLNHVGIAVISIDKTLEFLKYACGAVEVERLPFPEEGQTSCMVKIGDDNLELMEPLGAGVVEKFLTKNGEGLHHLSLLSDNLEEDCQRLEQHGVKIIGTASKGSWKLAFTHPRTTNGIIYEIAQKKDKND